MPHSVHRVVLRELAVIQKIIADEAWLEAERRGVPVSPHDPTVRANVCRVILGLPQTVRKIVEPHGAPPARAGVARMRRTLRRMDSWRHAAA